MVYVTGIVCSSSTRRRGSIHGSPFMVSYVHWHRSLVWHCIGQGPGWLITTGVLFSLYGEPCHHEMQLGFAKKSSGLVTPVRGVPVYFCFQYARALLVAESLVDAVRFFSHYSGVSSALRHFKHEVDVI